MEDRCAESILLQEEHRRMRYLRMLVDFTAQLIIQNRMNRPEAERVVELMRQQILRLFPGKTETYDIIYRPRFERIIDEFTCDSNRATIH